eukprot:scaffold203062_cov70-Attheya_sp.AAC.2
MSKIMLNCIILLCQHISSSLIMDYTSKDNHKVLMITMMAGEARTFSINKTGGGPNMAHHDLPGKEDMKLLGGGRSSEGSFAVQKAIFKKMFASNYKYYPDLVCTPLVSLMMSLILNHTLFIWGGWAVILLKRDRDNKNNESIAGVMGSIQKAHHGEQHKFHFIGMESHFEGKQKFDKLK